MVNACKHYGGNASHSSKPRGFQKPICGFSDPPLAPDCGGCASTGLGCEIRINPSLEPVFLVRVAIMYGVNDHDFTKTHGDD